MTTYVFPQLGHLLRAFITSAGYRGRLTELGLDKDLDDLAIDARPGSSCDLMQCIEDTVFRAMTTDCGSEWAQLFRLAWQQTRELIQLVVREVDTGPIADDIGRDAIRLGFEVPVMSRLSQLVIKDQPGMDMNAWWRSPVSAWIKMAAGVAELPESEAVSRLHDTPRTTERWMAGEPTRELQWPFRPIVLQVLGGGRNVHHATEVVDRLTGWLTCAVAFQSLPAETRDLVRRDFEVRRQHPWSIDECLAKLISQSFDAGSRPLRAQAIPLLRQIEIHFSVEHRDLDAAENCLSNLQHLINQETVHWRRSYQHIHDWFAGRLAATQGRKAEALAWYESAVEGVWWYGGPNQHPMISEALLYAVGVGDIIGAKHYWDKTFMLGLNRWPKRLLDEQVRRRLAMAFEERFAPLKAEDRVPPRIEILVKDGPFELSKDQLKSPNRKMKHAEGRTRRTPLMEAVSQGSLEDVKRAIAAGGDPNDYIKESGEGPLTYAMRRACNQKDPAIMNHLLGLDLLAETVNRKASTKRESPLKIAIEMADAAAVERLIVLGADVEEACDNLQSALCYAMTLMHWSIYRDDVTQEQAYLTGRTRADVYDAKDGAALDIELAARRQQQALLRNASRENRAIFEEVLNYFIGEAEPRREVVRTLLKYGADPNRRYKVDPREQDEWTPTLFAAQIGDLEMLKCLIDHGGDPDLTLTRPSAVERHDAFWIAVAYGRHSIVDFLTKLALASASR